MRLRSSHQILADEDAHEDGQSHAADEPEETERVQLLVLAAVVLRRLLSAQLSSQLHGIFEAGQVRLQTPAGSRALVCCRFIRDAPQRLRQRPRGAGLRPVQIQPRLQDSGC